jgi:hypothetical protein
MLMQSVGEDYYGKDIFKIIKEEIVKGGECMSSYVFGFQDIDKAKLMVVGGKGANLGELFNLEGIRVPDGFCISTEAFRRIIGEASRVDELFSQLSVLKVEDRDKISELSGEIRKAIEGIAVPQDINEEITRQLSRLGEENAFAVRSSATAEDLPTASFAGQHNTYLNIIGKEAILKHISKCWASLFTERAVTYRLQNGLDHRKVYLSVVVQKMVFSQAAGILFTADPITSNRKVLSIDASFGLGEALVSGLVNPDIYRVCNGKIIDKKISTKKWASYTIKDGGTKEHEIKVKAAVVKRKTLRHIRSDNINRVSLALRYLSLTVKLAFGIVKHRAIRAKRGKYRHLLPAPAGKPEQFYAFKSFFADQRGEPVVRNRSYGSKHNVPFSLSCVFKRLTGYGNTPFPTVVHPFVYGSRVDVCIVTHCLLSSIP